MRLRIALFFALSIGAIFIVAGSSVGASTTITPEVIERIKSRCVENQAALNRLHQTDAFLQNDRGNLYRTIGDKLMVPLNRRLASNQLDGGPLVTVTSSYNAEYDLFYRAYIDYDNALSKVLDIDCRKEPVAFYTALIEARQKRVTLSESNEKLKDFVRQYGAAFTDFKTSYEMENS